MKTITNKFKFALVAVGILAIGTVSAQTTTGDIAPTNKDIQTGANKTVRLVDNKGTIKYLQSANGITTLTNTTSNRTTTTFQLGGTLSSNTTLTLNDGTTDHNLTIDGVNFNLLSIEEASGSAAATVGTAGYTLLVKDELTGKVEKVLFSDLIESAQSEVTANAAQETANTISETLTFTANIKNILVFRNGTKLRANVDYTVTGTTLNIAPPATPGTNQDWSVYQDDVFEYHYSK